MSTSSRRNGPSPSITELLSTLADEHRRHVLYYLRDCNGDARIEDLREYLVEHTDLDSAASRLNLYHLILPELADARIITYDETGGHVRYQGGQLTTDLIEWLETRERTEQ